jgi:hypothetical protein
VKRFFRFLWTIPRDGVAWLLRAAWDVFLGLMYICLFGAVWTILGFCLRWVWWKAGLPKFGNIALVPELWDWNSMQPWHNMVFAMMLTLSVAAVLFGVRGLRYVSGNIRQKWKETNSD